MLSVTNFLYDEFVLGYLLKRCAEYFQVCI